MVAVLIGLGVLQTAAAIFLSEANLRFTHKALTEQDRVAAEQDARQCDATLEAAQIRSFDGARLRGWFFRPRHSNGRLVILLHGHVDNRAGVLGMVPMLLRHEYAVLAPDSRAHGESGGTLATFGIYETRDLNRWIDWASAQGAPDGVFGLGESMGAAILLEALPGEPRFCAAVADSPFASFREVAYDRLGQKLGGGGQVGRRLWRPLVSEAFLYTRWRYGIDYDQAAPASAVARTQVPVLLIHGSEDYNIPLRHCQAILRNRSGAMELWQASGAGHTGAFGRTPGEYERRVLEWFGRYARKTPPAVDPMPASEPAAARFAPSPRIGS